MPETLQRVAIISTPRTGNTWLRHLISRVWKLESRAVHRMTADDWASLPSRCVLQLHHRRNAAFEQQLNQAGFRIITLARHPLDVLISILHVAVHGVESEQWLEGAGGNERCLYGAMPTSAAFADYVAGPRAAELLAVTGEWYGQPGVTSLRYEDLVANPATALASLIPVLGPPTGDSFEQAIRETSLASLRKLTGNHAHFWQGRAGQWRELLPADVVTKLVASIGPAMEASGDAASGDPALTASAADARWVAIAGTELHAAISRTTSLHQAQIDEMQALLERSHKAMQDWEAKYVAMDDAKQRAEASCNRAHAMLQARIAEFDAAKFRLRLIAGCCSKALWVARCVQALLNGMKRPFSVHPAGTRLPS